MKKGKQLKLRGLRGLLPLLHPKDNCEGSLRVNVSLFSSFLKPRDRLSVVFRQSTTAVKVHDAKIELSLCISSVGSFLIPIDRLSVVKRNSVLRTKFVLSLWT